MRDYSKIERGELIEEIYRRDMEIMELQDRYAFQLDANRSLVEAVGKAIDMVELRHRKDRPHILTPLELIDLLRADIRRLREALEPFADAANDFDWEGCGDDHPQEVPVGWLRKARQALMDQH